MERTNIVKEQIFKFLESPDPEVIAIRGKWGTGKTYAWKHYLGEAKGKSQISLNKYAYVSLFGMESIDAVKHSIFEKTIETKDVGKEPDIITFANNVTTFAKSLPKKGWWAKVMSWVFQIGITFHGLDRVVSQTILFLFVRKVIVCLDDLERTSLSAEDIMGLISDLKEQKDCKVVLILNDEKLSGNAADSYKIYREKVIDKELVFSQSSEACSKVAFKDDPHREILTSIACRLEIENIRILKKIQYLKNDLSKSLDNIDEESVYTLFLRLSTFVYALYGMDEDFPDLEFIKNIKEHHADRIGNEDRDNSSDPEKSKRTDWLNALVRWGIYLIDDLDEELIASVERGYFIQANISGLVKDLDEKIVAEKRYSEVINASRAFHMTFSGNDEELVQNIYESMKNNIMYIDPGLLDSGVRLFRDLGKHDIADEIIDLILDAKHEDYDYFDLSDFRITDRVTDDKVVAAFNKKFAEKPRNIDAAEILERLTSSKSWNQQDEEDLASLGVDDYYNLFKTTTGLNLDSYIKRLLEFGQTTNASNNSKMIAQKTKESLRRIRDENVFNKIRMRKYGIDN